MNAILARARSARIYARRIAAGLCRRCGQCPPRPARALCAECQDERALKQEARRTERLLAGLCVVSGCTTASPDAARCDAHAERHREVNRKAYRKASRKGIP